MIYNNFKNTKQEIIIFLLFLPPRFPHSLPPSSPPPPTNLCYQSENPCMRFSCIYASMCKHVDVHAHARECKHVDVHAHARECKHVDVHAHARECKHVDVHALARECKHVDVHVLARECKHGYRCILSMGVSSHR
jgi:hypothetical protein